MSKYMAGDEEATKAQVKKNNPVSENKTWLRHKADGESGIIDLMILEGTYTIDDMIQKLSNSPSLTPKNKTKWEKRIRDHITHLSSMDGDRRNIASGEGGHNLEVFEDSQGVISFVGK